MKIALAQINSILGDIDKNALKITQYYVLASDSGADLIVFPELSLVGYPPEDLILYKPLLDRTWAALEQLALITQDKNCGILLGAPIYKRGKIYNAVALLFNGKISEIRYKRNLPNFKVFDEQRIFASGPTPQPIEFKGFKLGVMVCRDLWHPNVSKALVKNGAQVLIAINASPYEIGKDEIRYSKAKKVALSNNKPVIYVNQIGGQDGLVFDGGSFVIDADAKYLIEPTFWSENILHLELHNDKIISHKNNVLEISEQEHIYQALVLGLKDYIYKNGFKKVLIGLSGGIDSAMVAAIACDALGTENIRCVRLPSKFTSDDSMIDAKEMADKLGCELDTISIEEISSNILSILVPYFKDLKKDTTEENIQARSRAIILMALSNKFNELLLTTGNKSELAVGYTTLYGDMCGGFAVIKDVYKTQVYELARWRNANIPHYSKCNKLEIIPQNIILKAPSAELKYDQKDQDDLPPYETLDKILYALIEENKSPKIIADEQGLDINFVKNIQKMLYRAEYKRQQAPIGTKISTMSLSKDRRYPITNQFAGN